MTDGVREQDWQILQSEDLGFLRKTRGELQALLGTNERWTELMRSVVNALPQGRETEGMYAILSHTGSQRRLQSLLSAIDRRTAELTQEQRPAGALPSPQQKSVA